jgi:hypothetical protein
LNEDGVVTNVFDLYCIPRYYAASPLTDTWLEASCRTGLLSVNTKENYVQLAEYSGGGPRLDSPQGVTYGPDGTLYVLTADRIVAYKVNR